MDDDVIRMLQLAGQGYNCSQILIILGLEARGEENPGLIRAVSGLAHGCGAGRAACGVLTGACCLVGLFAGKGADEEAESDKMPLMLQELNDWFQERVGGRHGGIVCETILGEQDPEAARKICGRIVAETYKQTLSLLRDNGFDL